MSRYLPLLIAILFTLASPAFARATPAERYNYAGEFACGYATKYTDASQITIEVAAKVAAENWDKCEGEYGLGACTVQAKGYSSGIQVCDYAPEWADAANGGLALQRAERLFEAFVALRPSAEPYKVPTGYKFESDYKRAYLVIRPKPEAQRLPQNPDERWGFLNEVLLREADNLCPTLITADAATQTYSVQWNDCTCSSWDADRETPDLEVYSDTGFAQLVREDKVKWQAFQDLSFTQIRRRLEEGTTSRVVEVNENLNSETTPDGLSVDFLGTVSTLTARFPDRCSAQLAARAQARVEAEVTAADDAEKARLAEYDPVNGFVGGDLTVGVVTLPRGTPWHMNTGGDVGGHLNGGVLLGNHNLSWLFGAGVGVAWDPNCLLPAMLSIEGFTGYRALRSRPVGFGTTVTYDWGNGAYNGQWLTNRHRFSVTPIAVQIHPLGDREWGSIDIGPSVGMDLVAAATDSDIFVMTERRWVGVHVGYTKTFGPKPKAKPAPAP